MKALSEDLAAVCRRMREETAVAVAVHEKPDADALGAAAGMLDLFSQLGIAAKLHVSASEYLPLGDLLLNGVPIVHDPIPPDVTLYALDSGNDSRLALPDASRGAFVVNIDHHQDNTGHGDLTYVRGAASSTSEMVCDIAAGLDLRPSPAAATALYAGISFDTGHFRHDCTSASTFEKAAWLTRLGVDVTAVYAEMYERRTPMALRLWARAVDSAVAVAGGRGMVATLRRADYAAVGANENETEGIVESLRGVDGVEVAALVKEQQGTPRVRASLRSSTIDVSAVAALKGGGGHRLAAGFSNDDDPEEVTAWLSSELERCLSTASS